MKSVVVDLEDCDWEGDKHPRHEFSHIVIYELHVRGFTKHPSSGVGEKAGTYAGLVEKIPYLKELGVTAVELLPVQQFDQKDGPKGLSNYWGYTPISLFAPHTGYSSDQSPLGPVTEFRDMVKALHRNGIEVILDVVFNHSAEAGARGPTYSWKGFEAKAYYMLSQEDHTFQDFTGCGNTFNANQSIVRRMITDCLHYWVAYMHVDGFRFDLASVLSRHESGQPMVSPPLLWSIDSDPILANTKIIAEAWDAAGLYQLGSFVGHRWAEWNGKFRDDIRRFIKGDRGMVESLASKIAGSPDLFTVHAHRDPNRSINFITCHDGFSLNDLVSYDDKHNQTNRENNSDGQNANFSWNCGDEGPTKKAEIENLRRQQIKNLFTLLTVSQGTRMISMGDEVRRTQNGNNNAYCQDNEISWLDWNLVEKNQEILGFVQRLLRFHHAQPHFHETVFWINPKDNPHRITWHGTILYEPDWSKDSRSLAFTLDHKAEQQTIHVMISSYWESIEFQIPSLPKGTLKKWHRLLDTSLNPPHDICHPGEELAIKMDTYYVQAHSIVILVAKTE